MKEILLRDISQKNETLCKVLENLGGTRSYEESIVRLEGKWIGWELRNKVQSIDGEGQKLPIMFQNPGRGGSCR
jgi:hypothetical protein